MPLGNVATDISGAASNFAKGLIDERQRRQQLAMQQAMQAATMKHLGAESDYLTAETTRIPSEIQQNLAQAKDVGAKGDISLHDNQLAGPDELLRMRNIHGYEHIPDNYFQGATRGEAEAHITRAMQEAGMLQSASIRAEVTQNKPMQGYDAQGNKVLIYPGPSPDIPPRVVPVGGGVGQPASSADKHRAAMGEAALQSDKDLTAIENDPNSFAVMQEVARALQGPALARLLPFVGHDVEEALAQLRTLGLSPMAATYVKRLYDHASLVAPDRYGRQFRNPAILHQAWADFGAGQLVASPEAMKAIIAATQRNRRQGVQALLGAAGPRAVGVVEPQFTPEPALTGQPQYRTPRADLQP